MQTGQKVNAPLGIGTIAAQMGGGNVLVLYSKRDYKDRPEEWRKISPGNGPCVFRMYSQDELTEVE